VFQVLENTVKGRTESETDTSFVVPDPRV